MVSILGTFQFPVPAPDNDIRSSESWVQAPVLFLKFPRQSGDSKIQ